MNKKYLIKCFTILELLVVISILAILAGLLLPTLNRAKGKALVTVCLSNLRQLNIGWSMYISDHENNLPHNSDGPQAGRDTNHLSWVAGNLLAEIESGDKSDGTNIAQLAEVYKLTSRAAKVAISSD